MDGWNEGKVCTKKPLRICPARSGLSHFSFCAADPYLAMTSIFPVSGAAQFVASEAVLDRPKISAMRPYSRLVKPPAPLVSSYSDKLL